ncbi:MAG: DUF4838 domain-containing protein [Lentisphaeria bacterium]|nr:DUF4838 domain-containing protein [Lentisphaeria bacterium]
MKRFLTVVMLTTTVLLMAAPKTKSTVKTLQVAIAGEANSAIVVDDNASRVIWQAARELQNYFRLLTSARITIRNAAYSNAPVFILGTPESAVVKPVLKGTALKLVKKIKDDGYAVIVRGMKVYIIGATPRGVLNGVHRFIFNHTDFIWVRPHKELANFTFDPNLKLSVKDHVDNPVFRLRAWLANARIAQYSEEFFMYCVRNGINYLPGADEPGIRSRYADNGMFVEFGGGHNMSTRWLPKKVFAEKHPEYYMQIDGKRVTTGRVQLCYANEKMHEAFIANTLKIVKELPDFYNCINIMIDDTQSYCECDLCMAPIKLPNGKMLLRTDSAFKSTQFFIFLNKVAAAVEKARPGMKIKCFGYFFTATPPEIPIAGNIRISFCPYVRNDKETLHGPSNAKWLKRTVKYTAMSPSVMWREYYFSGAGFPRAQANIIAQDLRFISKKGIKEVTSEHGWGDRPGMRKKHPLPEVDFFNITGAEFWTITQLFWNPHKDPDQLRNEYIKRVYREGAPGVMKFYKLLRDSWLNDPTASAFNDDYRRSMGRYVIRKNLTEPCRAALAEAAKTVKNPVAATQLAKLTGTFEKWLKLAAASAAPEYNVPKVEIKDFPGFDFDSGVWKKAAVMGPMNTMGKQTKAPEETLVKIVHNGKAMYVAIQCKFPEGKTTAKPGIPMTKWPSGDHVELFLGRRAGGYYLMVYNTFANSTSSRYDAYCTDSKWNGEWDVKTEFKNGEWRSVAIIPFKTLGFVLEQNNRMSALVYRVQTKRHNNDRSRHVSWGGGKVHSADSFGDLVFALE